MVTHHPSRRARSAALAASALTAVLAATTACDRGGPAPNARDDLQKNPDSVMAEMDRIAAEERRRAEASRPSTLPPGSPGAPGASPGAAPRPDPAAVAPPPSPPPATPPPSPSAAQPRP